MPEKMLPGKPSTYPICRRLKLVRQAERRPYLRGDLGVLASPLMAFMLREPPYVLVREDRLGNIEGPHDIEREVRLPDDERIQYRIEQYRILCFFRKRQHGIEADGCVHIPTERSLEAFFPRFDHA